MTTPTNDTNCKVCNRTKPVSGWLHHARFPFNVFCSRVCLDTAGAGSNPTEEATAPETARVGLDLESDKLHRQGERPVASPRVVANAGPVTPAVIVENGVSIPQNVVGAKPIEHVPMMPHSEPALAPASESAPASLPFFNDEHHS